MRHCLIQTVNLFLITGLRELKIARTPQRIRSGNVSAWFKMVQTFNSCDMLTRTLTRTKKSKKKVITNAIVAVYGMSHKPRKVILDDLITHV